MQFIIFFTIAFCNIMMQNLNMMKRTDYSNHHEIIFNSINEGVFTIDADWRVSSFNHAAELITGISREEAIGRRCHEVFRTNICETACALRKTMHSGKPVINATAHIVNKSGKRIPIRISTALLQDQKNKIIGGVETFQDLSQIEQLRKAIESRYSFEDIIGHSPAMINLFQILPQIAESNSTVLIEGASGTGKELFARAIHNLSRRSSKPFVAVNCAALPDTLLESELFGYKAGAFTDARKDKPGRFASADGGTIFLDETGDISPAMQVKLLRVIQERTIEMLGSVKPLNIDVRIIAATNRSLDRLVKTGKFRQDLFYRIKVISLKIPELKNRREDIPLLIHQLIARFNTIQEKEIAGVSDEVMVRLMEHDFPGNVRELENIIEQAFVLCRGTIIELHHLPPELRRSKDSLTGKSSGNMTISSMEKILISETLNRCRGNRIKTAKSLGINPSTLYRKMKQLNLCDNNLFQEGNIG